MISRKCVCKLDISKIVRPLLAALSDNGLIIMKNTYPIESSFVCCSMLSICMSRVASSDEATYND